MVFVFFLISILFSKKKPCCYLTPFCYLASFSFKDHIKDETLFFPWKILVLQQSENFTLD